MAKRRLIERYVLKTIFPYGVAALLLLTAILFVQQIGRYFETVFRGVMPAQFVYGLALSVLPAVLVFTLPMAVLCGTIIGLGRMSSDSEIVAMRAAGISTWRTLWPALIIGLIATGAATYLNLVEAPRSQQQFRTVALRSALYKLDSPVEPRTFTNDFPGYVIYVRDGDKEHGQWGRVFIQTQDQDHATQLITARAGRIDSSAEKSELVLQDVVRTKIPAPGAKDQSYAVDRLENLRYTFQTGRADLIARLQKPDQNPDEMSFTTLWDRLNKTTGAEHKDAAIIFHKRLAFALTPFVFALFGSALALRMRRGSRGFGVLVSLAILIGYYLLTLGGDQAARAGTVPPWVGAWFATAAILIVGLLTLLWRDRHFSWSLRRRRGPSRPATVVDGSRVTANGRRKFRFAIANFPTLLDMGVVRTMTLSFVFGFVALVLIFDVFTTFELWKFISANRAPTRIVAEYLFYLLPLISVELFPGSVLVAALMTYALIAKRKEAVAWWSSGQSVYRLMVPGFVFAMLIAAGSWFIQERIMPQSNVRQDALRARIRGNIAQLSVGADRRWLVSADGSRIYAYDFDDRRQMLLKPSIYEFDGEQIQLRRVINGEEGKWLPGNQFEVSKAQWLSLDQPKVVREAADQLRINAVDPPSAFKPTVDRPSQFDSNGLRSYIKALKVRGAETTALTVALQRKYSSPFTVLVMALIGMPLAIEFGRKSTVIALCSAVVVSLAFWLISSGFQQLGEHSLLPPPAAVWTPIVMFACGGLYFISRVRT